MEKEAERKSQSVVNSVWKMTRRRLEKELPETVIRQWIELFRLSELSQDEALIEYRGFLNPDIFMEEYGEVFRKSLFWALGYEVCVKFKTVSVQMPMQSAEKAVLKGRKFPIWHREKREERKKERHKKGVFVQILFALLLTGMVAFLGVFVTNIAENRDFTETFYQVASGKVNESIRVIQLSDLHNTQFGGDNSRLIKRVTALDPDIIVMTGDMNDRREDSIEPVLDLCRQLVEVAPVYYIYGNNETARAFGTNGMSLEYIDELLGCTEDNRSSEGFWELEDELRDSLEETGVQVLWNNSAQIQVGETYIDIFGILTTNPGAFWNYTGEEYGEFLYNETDHFKLTLGHEPLLFETYDTEDWGDLVLCGHTHGGVIRIPYLGGFLKDEDSTPVLFPEKRGDGYFIKGEYSINDTPLIVSAGLTNKGIPRINNQPELVVIDINRY